MDRKPLLALLVPALLAACAPEDPAPAPATCTGTYSGAVSGTFTCGVTAAVGGAGASVSIETTNMTGAASGLVPGILSWPGALAAGAYDAATPGISSYSVAFAASPAATYYSTVNAGLPQDLGTFALTLDSATPQAGGGTGYDVHGAWTATLARYPTTAGTDTVTVRATF